MSDEEKVSIRLTRNDRYVLKQLIEHGRVPDSAAAREIGITPQAVLKIRNKLEEAGIIEGYSPKINYKLLGINVMALAIMKVLPAAWEVYSEADFRKKIQQNPYIIWGSRILKSDAAHILLYGFRDMKQMDEHFFRVQTKLAKIVEIKEIYSFSVDMILKNSPEGLFHKILEKKDFFTDSLFDDSSLFIGKK
jgi:DNA-binding Lrp family transcriptional regulator